MSNEKPKIVDFTKEQVLRLVNAIRGFFEVEDEFDESKRNFFKLTSSLAVGAAVKSSGAGELLRGSSVSEQEFKDTIELISKTSNGSDAFLVQIFKYFSQDNQRTLRERIKDLFNMDERAFNDSDLSMIVHNFKFPSQDFDFELIDRIFNNQQLLNQIGIEKELSEQVKRAMANHKFSGSVREFIKEEFAKPLFDEAEAFVDSISKRGLKHINTAERKFLKEIQNYLARHKFTLSHTVDWGRIVELEDNIKKINFALNPEEYINRATDEELEELFKKVDKIETKNAVYCTKYAPARQFTTKAHQEGRQVILQALGASEIIMTWDSSEEFADTFNLSKRQSVAGVVKITKSSTSAELLIKKN